MLNLDIEDNSTEPNKDYSWDERKIESLRQRVLCDETLTSRTDDVFLLSFLRARKLDEDDAFKYIKKYYGVRKRFPAVFQNLTPSAVDEFLKMNCFGCFKNTDGNGSVIITAIARLWDPSRALIWDALRGFMLFLDLLVTDNLVQTNGIIFILDYTGMSWRQIMQFTPNYIYTAVTCLFGSYPIRYKQIHAIVDSRTAYWLVMIVMPFLPRKIKKKMHIHSTSLESLHKVVDRKYLPDDFGGELPSFDPSDCYKKLRESEEFFKENETYWTSDKNKH